MADAGDELIAAPDGPTVFHRIHLPLAWQDGIASSKADWADDALDALIRPRLMVARDTKWEVTGINRELIGAGQAITH
jgi:hypothetical protein